jgi:hypothetical protein
MNVDQSSQTVVREPLVPDITREKVLPVFFSLLMVASVFAMTASPAKVSSSGSSEGVEAGEAGSSGGQWSPSGVGPSGSQIGVGAAAVAGGVAVSSESVSAGGGYVDVAASDLPGNGTSDDLYQISTASELQAIEDDLSANYTQVSDINASETSEWDPDSD